ncbi:glycosyltransferase [Coleofasciculus sp. FACHB-T130]|uniref:glycosyltransferase n=1 Tax=Cyanophyceae TaxID=3028117 RepID=UPI001685BA9A|nr:glycosyltransferase [Coleofasciculus sp. FACHB-T130]MBD1878298.1 glycosyltransferase [Coleofasciculus sp. FACHB-T130]
MNYPEDFFRFQELNLWLPKRNYSVFNYSDGSEEEAYLENCLKKVSDLRCHSSELVGYIRNWPSEYHLSPKRSNLLRPILLNKGSSILELGAGCGAITRYLGENVDKVIAVEGSDKRANIAALRCRDLENVQIVHGNFQNIEFNEKFDVVTLIGVLEYSGQYINSGNPQQQALEIAKRHLKNDGILILAIENKLGLKYFAGCSEDHTGILFDGLEGYSSGSLVRTFGKQELEKLLKISGFTDIDFLYPFPDYKLPDVVIRLNETSPHYSTPFLYNWLGYVNSRDYSNRKIEIFEEFLVTKQIEANGFLSQVSNSFLVLASGGKLISEKFLDPEAIVWKYNVMRSKEFMTQLCLRRNRSDGSLFLKREPIYTELTLEQETDPTKELKHYANESTQIVSGTTLIEQIIQAIRFRASGDEEFLKSCINIWYKFLVKEAQRCLGSKTELPGNYVDCTPWNLIVTPKGALNYIDREWSYLARLPIKFILFRGFLGIYNWAYLWIDAGWDILQPDKSFRSFLNFCLQLVELDINAEEFNRFALLDWEFQERTKLVASGNFDEFTRFLNSIPQSMLFVKSIERSQSQLHQTQAELQHSQSQLHQTQAELQHSQSQLHQTQAELQHLQSQLHQTQAELQHSQSQLHQTQAELQHSQSQLHQTQAELQHSLSIVASMETSKFWKLRTIWFKFKKSISSVLLPFVRLSNKSIFVIRNEGFYIFTQRTAKFLIHRMTSFHTRSYLTDTLVAKILQSLAEPPEYTEWINDYEPNDEELKQQKNKALSFKYKPLLSVILPVYKVPFFILEETLNSVLNQTYTNWELCIAFADIGNLQTSQYLEALSLQDQRVRLTIMLENQGISGNSNAAIKLASGEFIVLLDHDDLLAPSAFYEVIKKLNEQQNLDFLYSDKDCVSANSKVRSRLLLKPEWSPEILYSANYLTHLCVARRELVERIGGFRPETDGAQDWDIFFRITEQTSRIARINSVLYHWRIIQGSTSLGIDSKPYALEAQLRTIQDHLSRTQLPATVSPHPESGFRLEWQTPPAKVTIIIDGDVPWESLSSCIRAVSSFADSSIHTAKVVLPESSYNSQKSERDTIIKNTNLPIEWLIFRENKLETLAKAAKKEPTDVVLFVSGEITRFQEGWIQELSGWVLSHPNIGFATALILTEENIVVEAGIIVDQYGNGSPLLRGRNLYSWEIFGGALWYRNCTASSPKAVAFSYDHYLTLDGLPTNVSSLSSAMIKLCQASRRKNKRGLVNPHARAFLKDLPNDDIPEFHESLADDPYFHPAFDSVAPLKLRLKNGKHL